MREGAVLQKLDGAEVEARTQELGRELHRRVQGHRPSIDEQLQGRLMVLMMRSEEHTS